ncbi:4'-phosphopantetheinyl transferase superfamily protein [Massilia sp. W12]|uniref:4'-phosphopantetheinyl transferase family protein n=1 Tax=Massilia sp. W12 TaxID=3126507 RepID=UPI0030CCAE40
MIALDQTLAAQPGASVEPAQLARLLAQLDAIHDADEGDGLSQFTRAACVQKAQDKAEQHLATIFRAYSLTQHWHDFAQNDASLPAALLHAAPKRQIEFAAGRWCARQALRQLAYHGAAEIGIGEHRCPQWPDAFIGSISHSQGWALAVVGHRARFEAIGIDLEAILPEASAHSVSRHLAIASELAVGRLHGLPYAIWVSLLFSAKESLFKALYPAVGRYFHFHDALAHDLHLPQGRLSLRLCTHLSEQHPAGRAYPIRFAIHARHLITRCVLHQP